jgi:hypothetical protein
LERRAGIICYDRGFIAESDSERYLIGNPNADLHANPDCYLHRDRDADCDANPDRHADGNGHADCLANFDCHPDWHRNADWHAYYVHAYGNLVDNTKLDAHWNRDTHVLPNPGRHSLGNAESNADLNFDGVWHADGYAYAGGNSGPITLVQSNSVQGSGVGSVSVAFTSSNTAGNLIIAFVRMTSTTQTVTVRDTAGNIYSDAVDQLQTTDGHQIHIFYAKSVAAFSNNAVTATFSATNNHPWLAIYEYSGLNATNPLDETAHAQGSNSSPSTGATGTTTHANELLFVGLGMVNNASGRVTAGSGYALQQQDTNTSRAADETRIVSATGSYTGTFSLSASTNWSAVIATFTQ